MRDHRSSMRSEPIDIPLGIEVTQDGRTSFLNFQSIVDAPLARQLRDAALGTMGDRGGGAKSAGTARAYLDAAKHAAQQLLTKATTEELPLNIRTLSPLTMHTALFEGRLSPASVRTTLARRLLLDAAKASPTDEANSTEARALDETVEYLKRLKTHGFAQPSLPYSSDELDEIVSWCKGKINEFLIRRRGALRLLGNDASDDDPDGTRKLASYWMEQRPHPYSVRDWVAWLIALEHESVRPRGWNFYEALRLLSPTALEAQAAALLVINEFGSEGSMLVSMDTLDVRRDSENSSLVVIGGVKSRADRAVSRKGNGVSNWSGGRIIERWIASTEHLRRWTNTDHVWLWVQDRESPKTVRYPVATFIPDRPIILEGGTAVLDLPSGGSVRMSTQRMRKTWAARNDRAVGAGINGAIDPNHTARTSWDFYRGLSLSPEERLAVIAEGQDEYYASILATGFIISDALSPGEIRDRLWQEGLSDDIITKIIDARLEDTGTAGCINPRSAPGQKVGTLCRKTPFACLLCPNAVFTTIHLPMILALSDRIDIEREQLTAEVFISIWAGVAHRVVQVIKAFSNDAIQDAMTDIDQARQRLKLLKEVYDQ